MVKAICNISNIPLRKENSSQSEMVSMVLFGEVFTINTIENGWCNITTTNENYNGWISEQQCLILTNEPISFAVASNYPFTILNSVDGILMVPFGAQLPDYNGKNCFINTIEYTVESNQTLYTQSDLPFIAKQYLNVPYLWGGRIPFGIDCSGFTQAIYKSLNIQLPRDAYQQAEIGITLSFLEETKTGDLAFFDNEEGKITHVGIMLDPNTIIHASGKVRIDLIDSYGILNKENKKYSHKLRLLKRVSEF